MPWTGRIQHPAPLHCAESINASEAAAAHPKLPAPASGALDVFRARPLVGALSAQPRLRQSECRLSGRASHVSRSHLIYSAFGVSAFERTVCAVPSAPAAYGRSSRLHCITCKRGLSTIRPAVICPVTVGSKSSPAFCSKSARKMPAGGYVVLCNNYGRLG